MHPLVIAALIINIHSQPLVRSHSVREQNPKNQNQEIVNKKSSVIAVNLIAVNAAPSCTVPAAVKVIER